MPFNTINSLTMVCIEKKKHNQAQLSIQGCHYFSDSAAKVKLLIYLAEQDKMKVLSHKDSSSP